MTWWGNFLDIVSEVLLALATLWVTGRSLYGYRLETQADKAAKLGDEGTKKVLLERARTLYALAAFQRWEVLLAVLFAALMKLISILLLHWPF